jgi:hypothetical protein
VGALASVGFTVPLLVIRNALPDGPLIDSATLGLLARSVLGALAGIIVLQSGTHRHTAMAVSHESPTGPASPNADQPGKLPARFPRPLVWSLITACAIAALDAMTGHRIVLIGALVAAPVIATLSKKAIHVLLASLSAMGLGSVLGLPDDVRGSYEHGAFLAAIATVAVVSTTTMAMVERALKSTQPHQSTFIEQRELPRSSTS